MLKGLGSSGWTRTSNPPVNSCGEARNTNYDHVLLSCFYVSNKSFWPLGECHHV
jgi:hypothetical protein